MSERTYEQGVKDGWKAACSQIEVGMGKLNLGGSSYKSYLKSDYYNGKRSAVVEVQEIINEVKKEKS